MAHIDPSHGFKILHAVLRADASQNEVDRSALCVEWSLARRSLLIRIIGTEMAQLLQHVWGAWERNHHSITQDNLDDMVRASAKSEPLIDLIAKYASFKLNIEHIDNLDLDLVEEQLIRSYNETSLVHLLGEVQDIAVQGAEVPIKGTRKKERLCGVKEALVHLHRQLASGILANRDAAVGGMALELTGSFVDDYEQRRIAEVNNTLHIPTGIAIIDDHLKGLRRGDLTGLLGFTGQNKSNITRTMGYSAAAKGFHVLHIPFESSVLEEMGCYVSMHAFRMRENGSKVGKGTVAREGIDMGSLTSEGEREMRDVIVPDFERTVGGNLNLQECGTTWPEVVALIEREDSKRPIDLIIIDYLTLLRTPGAYNEKEAKIEMIQSAKQLAMKLGGHGAALLTPIQGSRGGYELASNNDGAWALSGIYQYSEMERSLDTCFYVWHDDALCAANQARIGSAKLRRKAPIASTFVQYDKYSRMVASGTKDVIRTRTEEEGEVLITDSYMGELTV